MLNTYIKNGNNKKRIIIAGILLTLFFTERFFHERLRIKLEKIVSTEISKINPKNSIQDVDYFYLPPKVLFKKINFNDTNNTTHLDAQKGQVSLSLFSLLSGKVKIKKLAVTDAHISTKLNQKKNTENSLPKIDLNFVLRSLPFNYFDLENTEVKIDSQDVSFVTEVKSAYIEKTTDKIWLDLKSSNYLASDKANVKFDLNTDLNWGRKGIFITSLNLSKESSQVSLTGLFKEEVIYDLIESKNPMLHTNEVRTSSKIDLKDLKDFLPLIKFKDPELKSFLSKSSGLVKLKANLLAETDLTKKREARLKLQVNQLKTQFTDLNEFNISGVIKDSVFSSESARIKFSDQSEINFSKLKLSEKDKNINIDLKLSSKYLELRDLLNGLNARATNIRIPFALKGQCKGGIGKSAILKCQSSGKLISAKVNSPSGKGAIVDINSASFKLESFISSKDIKLQASAKREDSSGLANGVIDFKKGFDIDFESRKVNFTNFVNVIASSSLNGEGELKGNVSGTSRTAQFKIAAKNSSTEFNKLILGETSLDVSYKYPLVSVENIVGAIEDKNYSANVYFNVNEENLDIEVSSQSISSNELRTLFSQKFNFPEQISFEGDLNLKASGSPDINLLDLDLVSNVKEVKVFSESFDNGKLHLKGKKGQWTLEEAFLIDQKKAVNASGALDGLKNIDIKLNSVRYDASQIRFLKDLGLNVSGPLYFDMLAKGPLEGPKATGKISSSKINGSFRKMGNLDFNFRLFQEGFKWNGKLFSSSLVGNGYIPFDSNQPFSFNGNLKDFDLVNILDVAKDSVKKPRSKLSGDFVKIKTNNLLSGNLSGQIKNSKFELTAPDIDSLILVQEKKRTQINKQVTYAIKQDNISSSAISFHFKNLNNMSFSKIGLLNLDFIETFIPGTEQLEAFLESDFELKTTRGITKGRGSSFLKGVVYRNSSFPYTFNSGTSKITWHSDHAKFSNISMTLNGSEIKGSGKLIYAPSFNLDFALNHKNLRMELPEKIQSQSNGRIFIKGSKLPLNLTGNIDVLSGIFALDILNNKSVASVQPSHLLPQKMLKQSSSPFNMDLDIKLINPFEINNAEVKGFATGFINVFGLTNNPRLNGKIEIQKDTKLVFQDKQFTVNEGQIFYRNRPPNNPNIFIDSEAEITDNNALLNNTYNVRMIIKGNGSNPELDFSSQPSLDRQQITQLVAIGTTSTQTLDQEIGQEQQATQSGLQLGSYLLQQNQAVRDFQKQTGTELELSSSVDAGGVNPKVGIKKAWTPKFSSNLSQTFGNQKQLSLDNKYKINKNLSTVIKLQNSRTDDASLINNRRVPDGNILGLDLEYNVEFK